MLSAVSPWQNAENVYDVNGDQAVTPLDALLVANEFNVAGERQLAGTYERAVDGNARYVDVNGDQALTASDFATLAAAIPATKLNSTAPTLSDGAIYSFVLNTSSLPAGPSPTLVPIPTPAAGDDSAWSMNAEGEPTPSPEPSPTPSPSPDPTPSPEPSPTPSPSPDPTPSPDPSPTPSPASVEISATDAVASEVGLETGEFRVTRSGDTSTSLSVQLSIGGNATGGTDYAALSASVTIPAGNSSTTFTVNPLADVTPSIEGIETVVVQVVADAAYTLGACTSATVEIRDHAGVKFILATGGVTNLPTDGSGRNVTNGSLQLTQDDTVSFVAVPTDGGDFAPGEPTWNVTGGYSYTGSPMTHTFGHFYPPSSPAVVNASTPADMSPKLVAVLLVPYPAGMTVSFLSTETTGAQYGMRFKGFLTPSAGATADGDLKQFQSVGLLELHEHLELAQPYGLPGFPKDNFPTIYDLPAPLADGYIPLEGRLPVDIWPTGADFLPAPAGAPLPPPATLDQTVSWRSKAADSLNTDWHDLFTGAITSAMSSSGHGYVVTTSAHGVSHTQPYSPPGVSGYNIVISAPDGTEIPTGGTLNLIVSGTMSIDVTSTATKTGYINLIDDDVFDLPFSFGSVTVPSEDGAGTTSFVCTWALTNSDWKVVGTDESEAEIYAELRYNPSFISPVATSNTVVVNAL